MTFQNPILPIGADPWITKKDGWYYYTSTLPQSAILVRKSRTITGLSKSRPVAVWINPYYKEYTKEQALQENLPPTVSAQGMKTWGNPSYVWAPELHFVQGKWYIYYANINAENNDRYMDILECLTDDPQGAYIEKGHIIGPHAIDGTVLEQDSGELYFIWSAGAVRPDIQKEQCLYISRMKSPTTLMGEPLLLSQPEYPWEKVEHAVNEGPSVLKKNGRIFITYAASHSWTDHYSLGMLEFKGGDVMNPSHWYKSPHPIFRPTQEVFGPGHASFTTSPDGKEDWILFHAIRGRGAGWDRHIHAQKFSWNLDGTPNFGFPHEANFDLTVPSGEEIWLSKRKRILQTIPVKIPSVALYMSRIAHRIH